MMSASFTLTEPPSINRERKWASRAVTVSRDTETLNLPLVLTDTEAKALAEATLMLRWTERLRFRFYLGEAQAALEPTDLNYADR